jgi:hypothetical protein
MLDLPEEIVEGAQQVFQMAGRLVTLPLSGSLEGGQIIGFSI